MTILSLLFIILFFYIYYLSFFCCAFGANTCLVSWSGSCWMLLRLTLHLDRYVWTAENHFCVPQHYVSSFASLDPTPSCPLSHVGKKMLLSPPSSHFFFHFSSSIPPVSDLCGLSSKDRTVSITEHVGWLVVNLQRYCWGVSLSDCETGLWRATVGPECKWKNGKSGLASLDEDMLHGHLSFRSLESRLFMAGRPVLDLFWRPFCSSVISLLV